MTFGRVTCVVDVSPEVVDAGAEMTLQAKVSCAPTCDLREHTLLIKDDAGADAGSVEITYFDGGTNKSDEFVVTAPVKPGAYTWLAVCPVVVKKGVSYAETSTPISFTVKTHTISVLVWDTPSTVVVGEKFKTKVGIKCSSECDLKNRQFGLYDHRGARVATGTLAGDRWPGTTGLYFAEIEVEAPAEEGLYSWSVRCAGSDVVIPHDEGAISFGVRVVSHPACLVTVETVDKITLTPLSGARVLMHPYRAVSDECGIAALRVAKGAYKLFVSQTRYVTLGMPIEVTSDTTARAELELEPVAERN